MINRETAGNYINKGYIITISMIERLLLGNSGLAIINAIFFWFMKKPILFMCYLIVYAIYIFFTAFFTSIKHFKFKNSFLLYFISNFLFVINANILVYNILKNLNLLSVLTFCIQLIIQGLSLLFFICIARKTPEKLNANKKYISIPYVANGGVATTYLIFKYFIKIPDKNLSLFLNLFTAISCSYILYNVVKYFYKWHLVKKFNIKEYNEIEITEEKM